MDFVICVGRIGKYIEEFARRFRIRKSRIQISRGVFIRTKERI